MKKILSSLFLLSIFCIPAFSAENITTVCANHILVPTEMDAIKLKSQIKNFEDFQYYAKLYSQCPSGKNGGDLCCFKKGQMVKSFEEASFNGTVGEVSAPVPSPWGYHLIWVTKKY